MPRRFLVESEDVSISAAQDLIAVSGFFELITTGNSHTNTTLDSLGSLTGVKQGDLVIGSGIPSGCIVQSITSGSAIVLSAAATSTLTGTAITFIRAKPLRIIRWGVTCTESTPPTAQILKVRARVLPATVTPGSGGSAPTPQTMDGGDAASVLVCRANDTTKSVVVGTNVPQIVDDDSFYNAAGYRYTPQQPIPVGMGANFVWELLTAPGSAQKFTSFVLAEELG